MGSLPWLFYTFLLSLMVFVDGPVVWWHCCSAPPMLAKACCVRRRYLIKDGYLVVFHERGATHSHVGVRRLNHSWLLLFHLILEWAHVWLQIGGRCLAWFVAFAAKFVLRWFTGTWLSTVQSAAWIRLQHFHRAGKSAMLLCVLWAFTDVNLVRIDAALS